MDVYLFGVLILLGLAAADLVVGVSNDAANFLNSSLGSKVAPRHVILAIASLGILVGVTFSSGMMEVARKGIFHPQLFTMPELIALCLLALAFTFEPSTATVPSWIKPTSPAVCTTWTNRSRNSGR